MDLSKIIDPQTESLFISKEGFGRLARNYDPANPQKNFEWTTDFSVELPIKLKRSGSGSEPPFTLIDAFHRTLKNFPQKTALRVNRKGKWISWSFKKYYEDCCNFGKALLSLELTPYSAVNIIGFNAPEWNISFFGSIFASYLPVGIYTTNSADACQYIVQHSEAEVIIAENEEQLRKFLKIWDETPRVRLIVLYSETLPQNIPENRKNQIMLFADFLELGKNYLTKNKERTLEYVMSKQKPGNCCTLVYTSGTTGPPKGVMISHDNYTWTSSYFLNKYGCDFGNERLVSYLPLSHVAAQTIDVTGSVIAGSEVTYATPEALTQGTLVEFLKEARPTFFFSVPRVWEKIEEKMKVMGAKNNFLLKSIGDWAKSKGKEGTFAEVQEKNPGVGFALAKKLVFNNIKKALGLEKAKFMMFGAAPMSVQTLDYFLSLNMFLINTYGMSECSGPETFTDPRNFPSFDKKYIASCGAKIEGTNLMLHEKDKDGNGEICYKGRNRFMGYYKNEEATRETIDSQGFLHSGDVGKLDEKGNLTITGRIKELLITAGGENIPPVLIENEVKKEIPFISNAMLIGDKKKYLVMLLTLKYNTDKNGLIINEINEQYRPLLKELGSNAKTYEDFVKDKALMGFVQKGIDAANSRATSRAQEIRKWKIIPGDFSVDGGELTPTLKLKRKSAYEKYENLIEALYEDAKI